MVDVAVVRRLGQDCSSLEVELLRQTSGEREHRQRVRQETADRVPQYLFIHFAVHCSLSAVTHAPFHASMLRPASQAGPMHEAAWKGKLVNAALLSLMRRVYAALPYSRVNSSAPLVCRHDRVTREAWRVGLVARDRGRRGY